MANNIPKAKDLSGLSIYQDPKKGTIFYDFITRKSFLISNRDVQSYLLSTYIMPVSVLLAFLFKSLFSLDLLKSILAFIAIFILLEILFRIFFVYKLTEIENYTPPKKENIIDSMANNYSKTRLIILLILLILLIFMMPTYAKLSNFEGINLAIVYLATFLTIVGFNITLIALIKKIKN